MAGVEKICEFSGEYPGCDMYRYKRNLIQIMPKYRNLFRGAEHELIVFNPEKKFYGSKSGSTDYNLDELDWYDPPLTVNELIAKYKRYGMRPTNEYWYVLIVFNEKLKGDVNGKYLNWTFDLPAVKRKLKRMMRVRKLNIRYVNMSYEQWLDYDNNHIV